MKKSLVLIILFLSSNITAYAQLFHKTPSINYSYSYITNDNDTAKVKRTPQSEWKKLSSIDNDLLTWVLKVESYLQQRQSGVHSNSEYNNSNEIEVYFNNLKNCAKKNHINIDLTDYENELAFYKKHPAKSKEEIRNEKIKKINDEGMEDYKRKKEKEQQQQEYNRKIGIKNDSIKKAHEKERVINDSIAQIKEEQKEEQQKKQNAIMQKKYKEQAAKKKIEEEEQQKQRRIKLVLEYGDKNGEAIFNHQVQIGWTKEMCIESWGKPHSINTTTTANNIHEQYVYSLKKYLYFDNGILTAFQN